MVIRWRDLDVDLSEYCRMEKGNLAKLQLDDRNLDLPVVVGTENERGIDISKLRAESGYITLDDGYANTGACKSAITYIDGEKGILRYRGIPIEQLAKNSTFIETALLLIYGELPTSDQLKDLEQLLIEHELLHEGLHNHFDGFPSNGKPSHGDLVSHDQRQQLLSP